MALGGLFSKGPAKPGDAYGSPGQGSSVAISIASSITLLLLWYLVTAVWQLLPPLFLPAPAAIADRFVQVFTEGFGGGTLIQHTWASFVRVFSAFFLSCVTAIPIGILMGVNRVARGIFDPPIVITSYSIHYTKLYDDHLRLLEHLPGVGGDSSAGSFIVSVAATDADPGIVFDHDAMTVVRDLTNA